MKEILRPSLKGIPEGGLCGQTDPELFFPESGNSRAIKRLCNEKCDVRDECRDGALERKEEFGIWGGLTKAERDRILGRKAVS